MTALRLASASASAVRAVDDVSLEVGAAETLALVGKSGCGKSTLGRLLLRLIEPTEGRSAFEGSDLTTLAPGADARDAPAAPDDLPGPLRLASARGGPSPRSSPSRWRSSAWCAARERRDRVAELLQQVGLSPGCMDRKPRQFSGGQRQRIGIARAISVDPAFIVADEPVSALDVSIQAQIINLMQDLQEQKGLSYLFIAHDLAVVRHIADRVAVMYLGRIVEIGAEAQIYAAPQHPYTQALLSAAPEPDPDAAKAPHHPGGRRAQPGQRAARLQLPHPLPDRPGDLPPRAAAAGQVRLASRPPATSPPNPIPAGAVEPVTP